MKFLGCLLVLGTLVGAISAANVGAGLGLNVNIAATTKAYPTVPPFINTLTSGLFNHNKTSGESPIYGLLKQLSSNIYPFISNTTYGLLTPLNNFINGLSSNLFNGLCAPPRPNWPIGGSTVAPAINTPTATAPGTVNPLTNIFNILTGTGGSTGTTGTTGTDPISQLLAALGGAAGNTATSTTNTLSTILAALGQQAGTGASDAQSLINSLLGLLNGGTGGSTGTPTTDPITALLNSLGLGGLTGGAGISGTLFPGVTVSGNVNTTLNWSPAALNQLLASMGQTLQSLQAALQKLNLSAQQFVNGLAQFGGNVQNYLQSLFSQANAPSTGILGGLFPGVTVSGNVNLSLNLSPTAFNQLLTSMGQSIASLQAALLKLNISAQQFVDGLTANGGNVQAYLQSIFNIANNPPTGTGTSLQDIVNNLLTGATNLLGGTGLLDLVGNLLNSLGLGR